MTSLQTHIAQIPGRVRFFLAIADCGKTTIDSGKSVTSLMTSAEFSDATSTAGTGVDQTTLMRDMGKSITVIGNDKKQQIAVYRLVQQQLDDDGYSEGADLEATPFYVKVWDSNGSGVGVVRTG